jgi:hypothetical protein
MVHERAVRAARELGDTVIIREVDTLDRDVALGWGTMDALFVDRKQVRTGPPPSYDRIRKLVEKRVKRLAVKTTSASSSPHRPEGKP